MMTADILWNATPITKNSSVANSQVEFFIHNMYVVKNHDKYNNSGRNITGYNNKMY